MSRQFDTESQEEDNQGTAFPNNPLFHNLPEGQLRLNSRDVNRGGAGRFNFASFNGDQPDTLYPYRPSEDSTLNHEEHLPPSTTTTDFYTFTYLSNALPTFPDTPSQDFEQTGTFPGEVINEDNARTSRPSGLSNLSSLSPVLSFSHIPGQRFPTSRRNHASGSTSDSLQASAVGPASRRGGRQRLSALSVSLSATSPTFAHRRHMRVMAPNGVEEAGHGTNSLPPSAPAQLAGLQRITSGNSPQKLLSHDYDARDDLIRAEDWLQTQMEEPAVTLTDEFVTREYIKSTDRTRFYTFVRTNPDTGMVACLIPHNVTVKGRRIACTYEAENAKDTIAHVALLFRYRGYKCQSQEHGHPCKNVYPTPERRNDHHSKVKKGADSRIECEICGKITLERNMERHMQSLACKAALAKKSK